MMGKLYCKCTCVLCLVFSLANPTYGIDSRSVKLNQPLSDGEGVGQFFQISPNEQYVVYAVEKYATQEVDLFRVNLKPSLNAGDKPLHLTPNQRFVQTDLFFTISPDSEHIIIQARNQRDQGSALYRVSADGGVLTKLSQEPLFGDSAVMPVVTAGSDRVVYLYRRNVVELPSTEVVEVRSDLYSVPILGGTPTKLNEELSVNEDVMEFRVSQDGTHVVYRADQEANDRFELFRVATDGSQAAEKLTPKLSMNKQEQNAQSPLLHKSALVMPHNGILANRDPGIERGEEILGLEVGPAPGQVVFRKKSSDQPPRLFMAQAGQAQISELSQNLGSGDEVIGFSLSAAGKVAVYLVNHPQRFQPRLFVVALPRGVQQI